MALGMDDGFGLDDAAALLTSAQLAWWAARAYTEEHRIGLRALLRSTPPAPPGATSQTPEQPGESSCPNPGSS